MVVLISHANSFAQLTAISSPTTEEEYNYLTKGYQTQISEGLDMKKGYHLKDMATIRQSNYEFALKMLIRESTNEIGGILVITKSLAWNKVYYMCIPHGNQSLTNRYWADLNAWDRAISIAYGEIMSLLAGDLMNVAYNMEKKIKN
jgi:hypothetical protein